MKKNYNNQGGVNSKRRNKSAQSTTRQAAKKLYSGSRKTTNTSKTAGRGKYIAGAVCIIILLFTVLQNS